MKNSQSGVKDYLRSVGKSISDTWITFQVQTTSHGIPNIHRAKGPFKRSLWNISMMAALLGLCWNIYYLADGYFSYNVTIVVEVKHSRVIEFPAVTICNNNPIKKPYAKFLLGDLIEDYIERLSTKNHSHLNPSPDFSTEKTSFPVNSIDECQSSKNICCNDNNYDYNNSEKYFKNINDLDKRSDYLAKRLILEKIAHEDEWMVQYFGQSYRDMVFDCTYDGESCRFEDFFNFVNNFHGNCYTFNSNRGPEIKKSKRAGSTKGLSIVFNVDQAYYIGELSQSAGLRVVVHDPRRMPYPEDEGILVSPGSLTHIGVTMTTLNKLGSPFGNCTQPSNREPVTIFQRFHNVSYTQKDCLYTCLNEEMVKRCSCADIKFPYISKLRQVPCCSTDNDSVTCMNSIWNDYKENNIPCTFRCAVPCSEIIYYVEVSSQRWPSSKYKNLISKQKRFTMLNESLSRNYQSFGRLVVYIQDLSNRVISEKPTYEIQKFISDIGGVLGLYVGFSLLTVVEFIEFIFDIVVDIFMEVRRYFRKKHIVGVELL